MAVSACGTRDLTMMFLHISDTPSSPTSMRHISAMGIRMVPMNTLTRKSNAITAVSIMVSGNGRRIVI